eukprot:GEMP01079293.1.p1 GENE.GEMP01079293.1~~GEMP01079293.1.p1  ORF type:complete len:346 (+),score=91.84 GEMP01079293.1:38-1039(+)
MPRLTLELIQRSRQDLNPAHDRQLTLRGNKIEVIENLGATQDQFSCIDLSDNSIMKLGCIPKLPRLRTVMLANNLIIRIDADIASGLTEVQSIVLSNNKLAMLSDLDPLGEIKTLQRLAFLENPVTKLPEYRPYVIYMCRNTALRVLDFQRILESERKSAEEKFSGPLGNKYLLKVAPRRVSAEEAVKEKVNALDSSAVERIKRSIIQADTMEEVSRLEKALKSGHLTAESLAELLQPQVTRETSETTTMGPPDKEKSTEEVRKADEVMANGVADAEDASKKRSREEEDVDMEADKKKKEEEEDNLDKEEKEEKKKEEETTKDKKDDEDTEMS